MCVCVRACIHKSKQVSKRELKQIPLCGILWLLDIPSAGLKFLYMYGGRFLIIIRQNKISDNKTQTKLVNSYHRSYRSFVSFHSWDILITVVPYTKELVFIATISQYDCIMCFYQCYTTPFSD